MEECKQKELEQFVSKLIKMNELSWNLRCLAEEIFQTKDTFYIKYINDYSAEDNITLLETIAHKFSETEKDTDAFVSSVNSDLYIDRFQELAYELQDILDRK